MKVLIAGGGIAGLETLMALRDLAGDRVDLTLVASQADFVYKPLLVAEPFTKVPAERHELGPLVEEFGGRFIQQGLAGVRTEDHAVDLADGSALDYDALVVCVGAKPEPAYSKAVTFNVTGKPLSAEEIIGPDSSAKVAFVVPPTMSWPLPIYELALMTRREADSRGLDGLGFVVVTPESAPLIMFGSKASSAVAKLLGLHRIEVLTGVRAIENEAGDLTLAPGGSKLEVDRIVALPALKGPAIKGLPADENGFIPIDDHARVKGLDGVYAAGDGTNFPIKHGGLGAQQADAAAEEIAARAGAQVDPQPFHPVIRGQLILGDESLNLQHDLTGGTGEGSASLDYLWWPPHKVGARYLAAFLAGTEPHADMKPPGEALDVEFLVPKDWHKEPMALDPYDSIDVD